MMKKITYTCIMLLGMQSALAHDMDAHELYATVMLDRLEMRNSQAGNSSYWEGQGWIGGDLDKLWFKTQGDAAQGKARSADAQLLYSKAVAAWWDAQAGLRHDFALKGLPSRDWLALAVKGLAPYKFDVDASAYFGQKGAAARIKTGYTLLLTQRLALLPELELNAYSKADAARGIGAGLSTVDAGLRLRYEITREFAPYVGVSWAGKYGGTAYSARQAGEPVRSTTMTLGVRLWW